MASRDIKECDIKLQEAWLKACEVWKYKYAYLPKPFLTCTSREDDEQDELFMMDKNGKDDDGDGKIDESDEWRSNAKAGQSKHNKKPSEAIDVAFKNKNGSLNWSTHLFEKLAIILETCGVKWGGNWKGRKDRPHYEI